VIGPILFVVYTADLVTLVESLGMSPHLYADDTQIYGSCSPSHVDTFLSAVTRYVNAVAAWMQSNRLQLNSDKTSVSLQLASGRSRFPTLQCGTIFRLTSHHRRHALVLVLCLIQTFISDSHSLHLCAPCNNLLILFRPH